MHYIWNDFIRILLRTKIYTYEIQKYVAPVDFFFFMEFQRLKIGAHRVMHSILSCIPSYESILQGAEGCVALQF